MHKLRNLSCDDDVWSCSRLLTIHRPINFCLQNSERVRPDLPGDQGYVAGERKQNAQVLGRARPLCVEGFQARPHRRRHRRVRRAERVDHQPGAHQDHLRVNAQTVGRNHERLLSVSGILPPDILFSVKFSAFCKLTKCVSVNHAHWEDAIVKSAD